MASNAFQSRTPHTDDFFAEVRRIVDLAPQASPAQRDLIAAILCPTADIPLTGLRNNHEEFNQQSGGA